MDLNGRSIRLIAGQHGNEKGPVRALESRGIDFIVGNPKAREANVRFLDQDLNASYGTANDSHESIRAAEILDEISESNLVIDFHTTSAKGPPFVILMDRAMLPLAERTGLKHAVLMTHNIKKGHALINARDGIAVEMSGYDTQESFDATLAVLDNLDSGEASTLELVLNGGFWWMCLIAAQQYVSKKEKRPQNVSWGRTLLSRDFVYWNRV